MLTTLGNYRSLSSLCAALVPGLISAACGQIRTTHLNSAAAVPYITDSSSLSRLLSTPAAIASAKTNWEALKLLSPSQFGRVLLASTSNDTYLIDGVEVSQTYDHVAATMSHWDALSKSYPRMADFVAAAHIQITFAVSAQQVGAGVKAIGQDSLALAESPSFPAFDYVMQADCLNIRGQMDDYYTKMVNFVVSDGLDVARAQKGVSMFTYKEEQERKIHDQGAEAGAAADVINEQWSLTVTKMHLCGLDQYDAPDQIPNGAPF